VKVAALSDPDLLARTEGLYYALRLLDRAEEHATRAREIRVDDL